VRKFLFLLILAFVVAPIGGLVFLKLARSVEGGQLQRIAEDKVGGLLQARVQVGEVKIGLLDRVSLKSLKVSQETGNRLFYLLNVDRMVFRYRWDQFWNRQFESPKTVTMDSPQFVFRSMGLPAAFLALSKRFRGSAAFIDELVFQEGKVRFDLPYYRARFNLLGLRGKLTRRDGENWDIRLESSLNQFFAGKLRAEGTVNPRTDDASLRLYLENLRSNHPNRLPVSDLQGVLEFEGDEVRVTRMSLLYKNIPVVIGGILSFPEDQSPGVDLEIKIGAGSYKSTFRLQGKLAGSGIEGTVQWGEKTVAVGGNVTYTGEELEFNPLRVGDYQVRGNIQMSTGDARFHFESGIRRVDVNLNLKNWESKIKVQADHIPFGGLDMVVLANFNLKPDEAFWKEDRWTFDGKLETDYLILDQTPFPEFQGCFHTNATRIEQMQFNWEKGFRMEGNAVLEPPFPWDAKVFLDKIRLEDLKSFLFNPLPEGLSGSASGQFEIRGEAGKTEVKGDITVTDGKIKGLDYEELWLRFYGIPPYLKLEDSKLKKGMRTFYLEGGIDLSKENMFQDIKAASSEKIIIWTGSELNKGETARSVREGKDAEEERKGYAVGPKITF